MAFSCVRWQMDLREGAFPRKMASTPSWDTQILCRASHHSEKLRVTASHVTGLHVVAALLTAIQRRQNWAATQSRQAERCTRVDTSGSRPRWLYINFFIRMRPGLGRTLASVWFGCFHMALALILSRSFHCDLSVEGAGWSEL